MTQDDEHLNLLGIFHFVVGGLIAFFSCFPLIHVGVGLAMVLGAFNTGTNPPPPAMGWIFIVFGAGFILLGWTIAMTIIVAGKRLRAKRSYMYCLVIAALECLIMPFGTALGVFTIIVLMKDSVKQAFEANIALDGLG